jgi:hypothetical protein
MALPELLREIEGRGVKLIAAPVEPRLRFRPASALTPELVEGLREYKAAILEVLEGCKPLEVSRRHDSPEFRNDGVIESAAEVLELARAHFGEIAPESREEIPYAAPEPGRDPMAHKHTDKALWFAGARERELERRRRYGLPSHIRLVDGGGTA